MLKTIGWKELIDLVDFQLKNVPAKVDTGARTSVLHCEHIELVKIGRKQFVKFVPLDPQYAGYGKAYTLPFHKEKKIKNSFGTEENRLVVKTTIRLFNQPYEIEFSLRDRSEMEYPVLLGRSFIRKKFLVDVAKSNLSKKQKNH